MIKRVIIVTTPSRLSLKDNQMECVSLLDDSDKKHAPIEDLGVVLVENQRSLLTVPLINALADNNVALVYCDHHMMPSSIVIGLSSNTVQSEVMKSQIAAKDSLKAQLWKRIVECKIRNQARLLDKLEKDGDVLKIFYSNVKSGDTDNREGAAAKLYWRVLFGKRFIRDRDGDAPNNMLNYGYSVLRSATTRALVGSGLNPAFGLFHRSRYNAMPLADDMMEPFRPFVDEIVYELYMNGETNLSSEMKAFLVDVLSCDTSYSGLRRPLQIGLSMTTASLTRCLLNNEKALSLPKLE